MKERILESILATKNGSTRATKIAKAMAAPLAGVLAAMEALAAEGSIVTCKVMHHGIEDLEARPAMGKPVAYGRVARLEPKPARRVEPEPASAAHVLRESPVAERRRAIDHGRGEARFAKALPKRNTETPVPRARSLMRIESTPGTGTPDGIVRFTREQLTLHPSPPKDRTMNKGHYAAFLAALSDTPQSAAHLKAKLKTEGRQFQNLLMRAKSKGDAHAEGFGDAAMITRGSGARAPKKGKAAAATKKERTAARRYVMRNGLRVREASPSVGTSGTDRPPRKGRKTIPCGPGVPLSPARLPGVSEPTPRAVATADGGAMLIVGTTVLHELTPTERAAVVALEGGAA